MKGYAELWRIPGAPLLIVVGTIARLGHGVTVVAWLLLVREVTSNYTDAGIVAGAISLATAAAAPVAGRFTDRYGAPRVLPVYAVLYSVTQSALLVAVLAGAPAPVLIGLAVLTGAAFPPMSPAVRATWTHLTGEDTPYAARRTTAMAAESALFELVFILGPLVVSGLVIAADAAAVDRPAKWGITAAIVVAITAVAAGTLVTCRGAAMRSAATTGSAGTTVGVGPLRYRRFVQLLAVTAAVAFSFGASPVAIAAFADDASSSGSTVTGLLIAVWSLGSAAGGVAYGALPAAMLPTAATDRQEVLRRLLFGALVVLTAGYSVWNVAGDAVVFGLILVLTGAVIAPATAILAELVALCVPERMLTESYTWFTCANMSCAAAGSALAGPVVDATADAHGAFWLCAGAGAVAAAVLLPGLLVPSLPRSGRRTSEANA